jgi:signal transduction histidine kinase
VSRRLLASWVAFAVIVLAGLEIPLAISYAHNQRSDALAKLEHDATAVGALAQDGLHGGGNLTALARIVRRYGDETDGRIVIVDRRGRLLVGAAGAVVPGVSQAIAGRVWRSDRGGQLSVAVPVGSRGSVLGAVGISTATGEVDENIAGFRWKLGAIAAAVLAATVAAAVLLSRWVTRPLRGLEHAAGRVGAGELSARARTDAGPPEVRSLARRFNETVSRLEELVRAQDAFVGDASHQLRTPLTALRLRLENGDVAGALGETERLARIVDALLALARAESALRERVELAAAVAERLDAWAPVADERGIRLESEVQGTTLIGRDRLGQVLDNLLANALVASPPASVVVVHGDAVALHVRDSGPGMTEDDRSRAFDRFWSKAGGSGLGLPIVKRLIEVDGGTVELETASAGGLDVVLHLPHGTGRTS